MQFVKEISDISDSKFSIIMHSRNCLVMEDHVLKRAVMKILMYQWNAMMGQKYVS